MIDHHTTTASTTRRRRPRVAALVASIALIAAACGNEDNRPELVESAESSTTETTAGEATTSTERSVVTADGEVAAEETTTTTEAVAAETTSTEAVEGGEDFPGEPLDFGPPEGTGLAVVGVAYDDELNFRSGPAPDADIIEAFGPLSDDLDIAYLGESWAAPTGVWWKVMVAGSTVWANQAFLGALGTPQNAFDEVGAELGVLMFESVEAAALAVAETRASVDPESSIVFAGEPLAFEVGGFAIVDVIGLGDDSVKGERIRVDVEIVFDEESGEEGAQDVAFVVLTNVDITPICGRGVSDGLCV